jgi:uncharacterized protein YpmS
MKREMWIPDALFRRPVFLFLILLAASLACSLPAGSSPTATPVPTLIPATTADAKLFQQQLATASAQFDKTGDLSITLTEQQLTSVLVDALSQQQDVQVVDAQVLLQKGELQVSGKTVLGNITVPVQISLLPTVTDGLLKLEVSSASFGKIPVPDKFLTQFTDLVNKNLNENMTVDGRQVQIRKVDIAEGKLTVTGKAR